jgi:uncharacterized protein YdaU (DUF1376 family)
MNKKVPAYQRYPDKWLADTRRLTWSAKGIYADILEIIWLQYQSTCAIPDDDEFIALELGCTTQEWLDAKAEICDKRRPLLTLVTHGLFSKGLWKECEKLCQYRLKQKMNGQKGGRPKKPKKASPSPSPSLKDTPIPPKDEKKEKPQEPQKPVEKKITGGRDCGLRETFKKNNPAYAKLVGSVHFVGVTPEVYQRVKKTWPKVDEMKAVSKAIDVADLMIHGVNEPGLFLNKQFSKYEMQTDENAGETEKERIKRREREFNETV